MPKRYYFDINALKAASAWHGGQSSMLYAISSTGYLGCGTIRPQQYDEDRPMTDDEWLAHLADKLATEVEETLADATDHDDIEGLQNILGALDEGPTND